MSSSLEDFLKFVPLECGPLLKSSDTTATAAAATSLSLLKPTRPSASGWTWLTVPRNCIGLAYRISAGIGGGCDLQAIQISCQNEMKIIGTTKLETVAVHIAASQDGRLVAVATADGSLYCYDCIQNQQDSMKIQFQQRWMLQNVHSHVVSHNNINASPSTSRLAAASASGPVRSMQFANDYTLLLVDAGDGKGLILIQANSSNNPVIQQPLVESSQIQVSCASWSAVSNNNTTSEQQQQQQHQCLVVGDALGKIHFYHYNNNSDTSKLVEVNSLDFPGDIQNDDDDVVPWSCTHLDWFTSTSLAAGYCRILLNEDDDNEESDDDNDDDQDDTAQHEAELYIMDWNNINDLTKAPTSISSCGDVVPFFAIPKYGRHVFYTAAVATHDNDKPLLLVASNVASDVGIISKDNDDDDDDGASSLWTIKDIPEGANIMTPTDQDTDEFTYALGIGVVVSSVDATTSPTVLLSSTDGSLSCWHAVHEANATFFQVSSPSSTTTILPSLPVMPVAAAVGTAITATTQLPASIATQGTPAIMTTTSSSSLFGSNATTTATTSSFGFGAAAAPSFGTSSTGAFTFAQPPAPASSAAATPGNSIFGMTSLLGPKPPDVSDKKKEATAAASISNLASSGFVFGSGTAAPTFTSSSSSPAAASGAGGFAALAAAASTPVASAFGSSSSTAFGFPTSTSNAATSSSSQFNIFAKSTASSGLSAMAKPLFGSSSDIAPATTNAETNEQAAVDQDKDDNDANKNPFAAFSNNKPVSGAAAAAATGFSFGGDGASTTSISNSGFSFGPQKSASSNDSKGFLFATSTTTESSPFVKSDATVAAIEASTLAKTDQDNSAVALAESRDEPVHDSMEAKNAARAFDLFDAQKTGVVSRDKLDDLLEELGEGFYGDELDEQIALMDPDGSGQLLKRSHFINWYVKLSQTKRGSKKKKNGDNDDDDDDSSSMDSDERAEREEEAENCRERFSQLSQDGNKTIKVQDFEKLIESFGTTYCADGAHGRAKKKLDKNGVIYLDDFISWYLEWYFGEDDESSDDEDDEQYRDESTGNEPLPTTTSTTATTTTTAAGWGNMFAAKAGSWKCDSCMLRNDDANATKCVSCDTPRPGATSTVSTATETGSDGKTPASAIGPGGFTFDSGGATSIVKAPASTIVPGGFTFGSVGSTSLSSTAAPTFGGLAISASTGNKVENETSSNNNTASSTGIGKGGFTFASQGMGMPGSTTSVDPSIKGSSGFSFGAPVASQSLSGTKGFVFSSSNTTGSSTSTPGTSTGDKAMDTSAAAQAGSTSAETRNEPAVQDQALDSIEAKNAARAFDSFDPDKTGVVSRDKLDDLLEELGEGFYGDELDEQIALMDPDGSGQLKRSAFISWYVKLSQTLGKKKGGDDDSSMDSEERAEREEETNKCRDSFSKLSQDGKTIKVDDFPKLIEAMGTTYCSDGAHGRAKKQLDKNGSIELNDFIAWYMEWYFGEDDDEEYNEEESSDDTSEDQVAGNQTPTTTGWGNMFIAKAGSWKCDSCMLRSDDANATKCVSCDTPRAGATAVASTGTETRDVKAPASSIGPGGFSFGGVTTGASNASAIGPGGFSFGGVTTGASIGSAIGPGGFSFGGATSSSNTGSAMNNVTSNSKGSTSSSGGFSFGGTSTAATGAGFLSGAEVTSFSTGTAFGMSSSTSGSGFTFGHPKATPSTPASAVDSIAAVSSSAYPPMSKVAPKVDFAVQKPSATSAYPPLSKAAPKVDFAIQKPSATSAYPPLSKAAPKVDFTVQKPSATNAYPPLSKAAPKVDFAAQKPSATSAYPPLSKAAPKVDFAVQKPSATSAYPPMSKAAPKVDFAAQKPSAKSTSAYPPMSKAAPKVDSAIQKPTSAYPPMSKAAPKVEFAAQKLSSATFQVKPASTSPRYGHPSAPRFAKDETLSECATEFVGLVTKMQKSLDLVASGPPADQDAELRSSIEDLVNGVKTILASFGENNASLADCKRTSVELFAKTDEALRKASEAQRLINNQQSDRGHDFLFVQPLDAASEKLQRAISEHGLLFDRYLALLRERSLLVEQLCTPDAKIGLARSCVDITKKVQGFDVETKKMTSRCTKLSSTGSQFLLSPRKPVSTLTTRQQENKGESHKSSFSRRLLHMNPSSFDEIRSSHVKSFNLDRKLPKSAKKPRPERRLSATDTYSRSPDREVEQGTSQHFGPTSLIFSSPEPARHRSAWDKISQKVDQTRSKQVSFASPRDLREISLDAAARDALSPYGTTPEKVQGAIAIQNRVDTPAVSKHPAVSTPNVQDNKDFKARAKNGGKLPSSTLSLLPSSKPTPVESSESRQPSRQVSSSGGIAALPSKASQVSDTSTSGTLSSFPSKSAEGTKPSASGLFSSFPSSVTTPSQAETKPADTAVSKPSAGAAVETAKADSAFGSMSLLGSSLFSTDLESRAGTSQTEVQPKSNEEPDYAAILAAFYQTHNPSKAGDAKKMVEKYKGREAEMFMKLGKKYGVPSPLDVAKGSTSTAAAAAAPNSANNLAPQPFGSSPFSIQKTPMPPSPFTSTPAAAPSPFSFTSAPAPVPSTIQPTFGSTAPTFGSPAPAFGNPSTPAPSFGSTATQSFPSTQSFGFGNTATTQSPFGGGSLSTPSGSSPFGPPAPAPAPAFSGRSPRELLTAFYQQYNAAKISDVDKLLAKYQGKEEHMFRQLAKKYNLDPSVFGLPPSPIASSGFGSPALSTGFASSPAGFGSPSVLGGGPVFGASPFGASSGAFGQSTGGFGSASGTSFSPAASGAGGFAALAGANTSVLGGGPVFGGPRR